MAIQYCSSFSLETLQAVHDFDNDTIRMALYDNTASFDSDTTVYGTTGELTTLGYTAGGVTLSLISGYPQLENGWGSVRFEEASWTFSDPATIRHALMYNASKSNRAILSITFPLTSTQAGPFIVRFPLSLAPQVQHRFSLG